LREIGIRKVPGAGVVEEIAGFIPAPSHFTPKMSHIHLCTPKASF